jgi:hypothetical protein
LDPLRLILGLLAKYDDSLRTQTQRIANKRPQRRWDPEPMLAGFAIFLLLVTVLMLTTRYE